jgi:hypothetical protein
MTHFKIINLPTFKDDRGALTVLDGYLPFLVKRTYWIYESDFQVRGGHRHHKTVQGLVAIAGCVEVFMDDGVVKENIILNSPAFCLLVAPKDWHTMKFHSGSILLVMASEPYDKNDYIDANYE